MTVFIRRAPVGDNTASECIPTIAATYGVCKILQLYEYYAKCRDTANFLMVVSPALACP